ncbi:MAG: ABC transporter ATP-binding protein, partial [Alistipes sp.]|nr:ABC transporter ATP-binding protein [Alistipes sp.]
MIELKNLTLGYEERELLSGVNATLKPASLTALVGRNGSGKSTLLRAIASLGDIIDGSILIDGVELHRLSARRLAESVAFVSTERVR